MLCELKAKSAPKSDVMPKPVDKQTKAFTDDATNERWYVVHTQPHGEARAIANLERQGFRTFCPRLRNTVRHARKIMHTLTPLFPNYLFVELDITRDPWGSVNGTYGVIRLVAHGDAPQPVPRGIVERLQARTSEDGAMDWTPSFMVGQSVRIADGPFADFVGTLEQMNSAGRVRVLLDMLGRSVSVALRSEALIPAA